MRLALTGNPNSGKTTMYNAITGRKEKIGNWAGVTVDKKEYAVKKAFYEGEEMIAVDLPGAYSMSPYSSEESITSAYVKNEHPDVIINVVDATNLGRSLFFTTQLLELGIPVVIALFSGTFFPDASWVAPLMYFVGIALILLGALLIKAITGMKYRKSFFIIELPEYKIPSLKFAVGSMLERGKAYVIKAGTVILICNTVVQMMQSFDWRFRLVEEGMENTSILATISAPFAYLLVPIVGFAAWQLAAASITGFIAKENVVGTLATVYALTNFIDTEELELINSGGTVAAVMGLTKAAALAYLMFNLFTPPCFAAMGALSSELQSRSWLLGAIMLQLATGFTIGFLVYQIGTLITTGSTGAGLTGGFIAVAAFVCVIIGLMIRNRRTFSAEYQLD